MRPGGSRNGALTTGDAEASYVGHAGVRRWLEEQAGDRDRYELAPERFAAGPDGEITAFGTVKMADEPTAEPVCAAHWLWNGLIMKAEHRHPSSKPC